MNIQIPAEQVFAKEKTGHASETPVASQVSDKPLRDPETPRSSGTESKGTGWGGALWDNIHRWTEEE